VSEGSDGNARVRRATEADIPAMLVVERRSERASHWTEQQYRGLFSSQSCARIAFVIEENGCVEGILVAHLVPPECEIENLAVAESVRRKGFGKQLHGRVLEEVKACGAHAIFLEVRASNLPARRFYEAQGYRQSGQRKGYYRGPVEDAILYQLKIPQS